jgi:hypothetical protein
MYPKSFAPLLLLLIALPVLGFSHEEEAKPHDEVHEAGHSHEARAGKFTCPMHPEVTSDVAGKCANCGMTLTVKEPSAHYHAAAGKVAEPTIKATVSLQAPLEVGKQASLLLHLAKPDGSPVIFDDLAEAHTKKIHLLINDTSLTDYHHEHPIPTQVLGEYRFSFTPQKPGPYRVWADLKPVATGIQEYAITAIASETKGDPIADLETQTVAMVEGLKYEIRFDQKNLTVGEAAMGKLSITTADGKTYDQLEPLMAAYAHIVAFADDFHTIVHIHPMGAEPTLDTDRGTGSLDFHIQPTQAGLMRLYAQVQIGGVSKYARFTLHVAAADR